MKDVILFLLEAIAISAVLYLLYLLLFRGKATYLAQRVMLLSIPIIATLSAVVSFDMVAMPYFDNIPAEPFGVLDELAVESEVVIDDIVDKEVLPANRVVSKGDFVIIRGESHTPMWKEHWPLLLWVVVSLLLVTFFVIRLRRIFLLRRLADREEHSDYVLYRFSCDDVIFSFWRGVYLSQDIDGEKFDYVLCHELGHVRCRHYIDKLIAEIYMIFMWFNPIVRVIQRELSLIHEYEADHVVVENGFDLRTYQLIILDEVTSPVPTFANGINSSMIKKRFITMRQDYRVRHRVLRTMATLVTFAIIIASSLVYVQAENINDDDKKSESTQQTRYEWHENSLVITQTETDGSSKSQTVITINISDITQHLPILNDNAAMGVIRRMALGIFNTFMVNKPTITSGPASSSSSLTPQITQRRDTSIYYDDFLAEQKREAEAREAAVKERNSRVKYQSIEERTVFQPEDYKIVNFHDRSKYRDTYYKFVICHKDYTQVDFVINVAWDWHWLVPRGNSYLLDKSSGDKYMQHSTLVSIPINRAIYFHGLKGKTAVITSIYPPLDKGIKEVDLIELEIEGLLYPTNNYSLSYPYNNNLKVYDSVDDLPYSLEAEGKVVTLDPDFKLPKNDSKLYN